jgi:hypothetical protein
MPPIFTSDQLPATTEAALREFDERYLAVVSAAPAPTWADRFVTGVSAPRTTFPISLMSTKYNETKEASSRFETMAEKEFDVKVVEFDAGYEVKALELLTNAFAYKNFQQVPQRFTIAEGRHVCRELAVLLEAGTSTVSPWDGVNFFSTSHLANPSKPANGTWSNYNSSALDPAVIANLTAEITSMRSVRDENGDKLGVEPDEIWLPTGKFQAVSNLLNQNMIGNGESNPMLGKLKPVHVPELADVNDWYLVDSKMIGMGISPLFAGSFVPSSNLGLRYYDESSDFFKNTGKIRVSSHIWYGFGLVMPHAIRRVAGA